jgi:hypothetical protein
LSNKISEYQLSAKNDEYDGLIGLTFIDEHGNEMPAADAPHVVQKAQSFGGDRSAAGRYAAQVRWGKGGGESSAAHGLNTDRPTQRAADGTLLVQGENGGWRGPTASERGVPTAKEAKQELSSELAALGEIHHYEATELRSSITAAMTSITRFHKEHDAHQRLLDAVGPKTARGEMSNLRFTAHKIWNKYGSANGPQGGSTDSRIKEIADSVHSKLTAILDKMESLATHAR